MCDNHNTINCIGALCSRRATCKHYFSSGQAVDWSTRGSGKADANGITLDDPVCGPYSNPSYAKYVSIDLFHVDLAENAIAVGKMELNPWTTLTIDNCEKIVLKPKGIDFETILPTEYFNDIEEIIINGNKFIREK